MVTQPAAQMETGSDANLSPTSSDATGGSHVARHSLTLGHSDCWASADTTAELPGEPGLSATSILLHSVLRGHGAASVSC